MRRMKHHASSTWRQNPMKNTVLLFTTLLFACEAEPAPPGGEPDAGFVEYVPDEDLGGSSSGGEDESGESSGGDVDFDGADAFDFDRRPTHPGPCDPPTPYGIGKSE